MLVVEEAEVPERPTDYGQATGKLYHLRLRVECTPPSSTTKTGRHDIAEILLKVALSTIHHINQILSNGDNSLSIIAFS